MAAVASARFARAFAGAKRVALDTGVLIYHFQNVAPYATLTTSLLTHVAVRALPLILSTITVSEVLVGVLKSGLPASWLEAAVAGLPHVVVADVTWSVARTGAELRARTNLPVPDALILASAIEHQADLVVTNDAAWRIKNLPCHVLVLEDYL